MNNSHKQRSNHRKAQTQLKAKVKKSTSSIRIIGGKHRGRKLPVLDAEGLRPTTDRVKETVFNWLMPYISESHCLDCFAGAGSLGFEALSRGASTVIMIELDKATANQLQQNKAILNADNVEVIHGNALTVTRQQSQKFNIVFIDPPFRQGLAAQIIELLDSSRLSQDALIYLEVESDNSHINVPNNWRLLKEKTAGQVSYRLFQCD